MSGGTVVRIVSIALATFATIVVAASCGGASSGNRKARGSGGGTTAGTSAPPVGCLAIVNGDETAAHPAVVLLALLNADGRTVATCTGTFVGANAILTAAHCVPAAAGAKVAYVPSGDPNGEQKLPKTVVVDSNDLRPNEAGISTTGAQLAHRDGAVLIFDGAIAPGIVDLNTVAPVDGADVEIVGYGLSLLPPTLADAEAQAGEVMLKRLGRNTLVFPADVSAELNGVFFLGGDLDFVEGALAGKRSIAAPGDSGGPLLSGGKLVGVASLAGVTTGEPSLAALVDGRSGVNIYGDVRNAAFTALLARARTEGAKLGATPGIGSDEDQTGSDGSSGASTGKGAASVGAGGAGIPCP